MKKIFGLFGLFGLLLSLQTQAAVISVELDNTSYQKGDVIRASIWMSHLNTALAGYDLALWFKPAALAFDSISFGNYLTVFDPTDKYVNASGNLLSIFEMNLDALDWELADLQVTPDNRFQLATISFIAKQAGAFVLNFEKIELTDGQGFEISNQEYQFRNATGVIEGVDVPAPAPLLLLAPALLWLARRR